MEQKSLSRYFEVSGNGNHGCIVGRIAEFRNKKYSSHTFQRVLGKSYAVVIARLTPATATSFILYSLAAFRSLSIRMSTTVASREAAKSTL